VRFGEPVLTGLITVKRANGSTVSATTSGLAAGKKRLRARFARRLAAGKYTVRWRVKADDGDTEKGAFRFTVR
jgi:methionine-rich copper-binding protein CopC